MDNPGAFFLACASCLERRAPVVFLNNFLSQQRPRPWWRTPGARAQMYNGYRYMARGSGAALVTAHHEYGIEDIAARNDTHQSSLFGNWVDLRLGAEHFLSQVDDALGR